MVLRLHTTNSAVANKYFNSKLVVTKAPRRFLVGSPCLPGPQDGDWRAVALPCVGCSWAVKYKGDLSDAEDLWY